MSKHDDYTQAMKRQLDDLNEKMNTLDAKAAEAKADARDAYKAEVAKLRHQYQLAQTQFDKLKAAGEESWDKTVAEMDKIRDAFVHSFSYFKSQI